MGRSKRANLIDLATRHTRRPNPARLAPADVRPECQRGACRARFTAVRPHQRFCSDRCRVVDWQDKHRALRAPTKQEAS